jgi:maleate isomerase
MSLKTSYSRVGLIVPSSNITMETEIPALLKERERILPERFTFHSSRMRMKSVVKEELEAMDADSLRCAAELSDAAVNVQAYACLVAIMSMGFGYHRVSSEKLHKATADNGRPTPVLNSAGALIDGLKDLGAKKVSIICPYLRPLTKMVVDYIENEGIEVQDFLALEISDNLEVAMQDPTAPAELWRKLDLRGVDAIVASACVQMPSLPSIEMIEKSSGLPTLSAAVATTCQILRNLDLTEVAPGGGALLANGLSALGSNLSK